MAFERFVMSERSFIPKVSIRSSGQIRFSSGAVTHYNMKKFDYVVFLYDRGERIIGLDFAQDKNARGVVKVNKRKTGMRMGAKAFLDYYNIDYSETKQYTLEYDKENKIYIIDLDKAEKNDNEYYLLTHNWFKIKS